MKFATRRAVLKGAGAIGLTTLVAGVGCDSSSKPTGAAASKAPADAGGTTRTVWKIQTSWDSMSIGYNAFEKFARQVGELTDGELEIEPLPNNSLVKTFESLAAVKSGDLDGMHGFPAYWTKDIPAAPFFTSYPLGMDRPDQWTSWFYELGGLDIARKAYAAQNVFYVGPIHHDLNLIHSKIPLRSYEDFKGKRIRLPAGLIGDVFHAAGVDVVTVPGSKVLSAMRDTNLDAADFAGPAINFNMGIAEVSKFIIMGPTATPCLHQPCDLMEVSVNLKKWNALSPRLQALFEVSVRKFCWDHYAAIQRENVLAWPKYRAKGIDVIRLSEVDVEKFRRVAVPLWFEWAKKDPLATAAFRGQLEYMKSDNIGYVHDSTLVDSKGQKLSI